MFPYNPYKSTRRLEVVDLTTATSTTKYTLREARQVHGMSKAQLSQASSISMSAINSIEEGGEYRTNIGVALLLAEALALEVHEIDWPRGLSHLGRPPLTGVPLRRTTTIILIEEMVTVAPRREPYCERCFLVLPSCGVCGNCG